MIADGLRLARIAEAHHKTTYTGGMTDGYCNECGWTWPCPTHRWATEDHDPLFEPWDLQQEADQ